MFEFLNYRFDNKNYIAIFSYKGVDNVVFTESYQFENTNEPYDEKLLDRALFLSFILIGTSYYKIHPTKTIILPQKINEFQARFFNKVYQEGMSQFAFENNLKRKDLAHFEATTTNKPTEIQYNGNGILSLQSGGKDSLLTATLLKERKNTNFLYVTNSNFHPKILDELNKPLQIIKRKIDREKIILSTNNNGKNGHIPITYILESIALIQAILNGQNYVLTSIGREGNEPHAFIDDLPVNHQWNKTWEAEKLFQEYVSKEICKDLKIGSPIRGLSELKIAELFVQHCWKKYGTKFSSCNIANYKQNTDNSELSWCNKCAKCANSYLLFSPFLSRQEISVIFPNDLFLDPEMIKIFKGLLGVEGVMKPFECIGEIDELRTAYSMRQPSYSSLPFDVQQPNENYDYNLLSEYQPDIKEQLRDF